MPLRCSAISMSVARMSPVTQPGLPSPGSWGSTVPTSFTRWPFLSRPLVSAPSAGAFFEKAGAALAAYGAGDRDGAMALFLSVVCSLDWETCRKVIDKHVPGGVADAMKSENVDNFFASYLPALTAWSFGIDQAASISRPVLSLLRAETERWFTDGHELLHSWFPQVEDCRIEGVGHLLHRQRPAPVARGVAEFIARHPMTGADIIHGRSASVGPSSKR